MGIPSDTFDYDNEISNVPLNSNDRTKVITNDDKEIRYFGYKHPFSNFYESKFRIGDIIYPTVEHYYQCKKTDDPDESFYIMMAKTPKEAKKLGGYVEYLKYDWDIQKNVYMYKGIKAKFSQNEEMKNILLRTGDKTLIENNIWDNYWGCGKNGKGRNMAGKILMKVRGELV